MNDIRFVAHAPGKGELYINGIKVPGVISVDPDLFLTTDVARVTVVLSVSSFKLEPAAP